MAQDIGSSNLLEVWASSGQAVEPDISKIEDGWQLGEQPPHEFMNWLQNTFGEKLNHVLSNGTPLWNSSTSYGAGSTVQRGDSVWIAMQPNANSEPAGGNTNWSRLLKLADATTEATADKLVLRNSGGTFKVGAPTDPAHPLRAGDADTEASPGTLVQRDANGTAEFGEPSLPAHPVRLTDLSGVSDTYFAKTDRDSVAWVKTGNDTAETGQGISVGVGGAVLTIPSGTPIEMPALTAGTDYAIWCAPDGTLEADESYSVAPTTGGRRIGGFHYAPGGNASFAINAGDGDTTPQINEYSFHDLKWKPAAPDPRGLTLVGDGAFWCGIYHLAQDHLAGPPHRHGVSPARDGSAPQLINGAGNYPDAQPMNIFEVLAYHGFRTPRVEDFQLLAFGTNEEASRGSDPILTGLNEDNTGTENPDEVFTSHWGVIQSTGVISHWSNDSILSTADDEALPNPSRGGRFRVTRFARLGGLWSSGADSGSRDVSTGTAGNSFAFIGSRGITDHVVID